MNTVISFPKQQNTSLKLTFCKSCLKRQCPDISSKESGVIAMIVPLLNTQNLPCHAYITISAHRLRSIFSDTSTKMVDLARHATIHCVGDGFEPPKTFMEQHFATHENVQPTLH